MGSELVISVWFKTTTADGVLASLQKKAVSAGGTLSTGYNPVLYIGNDGDLYGLLMDSSGQDTVLTSGMPVDDGLWHHAVLECLSGGIAQTLYLDGEPLDVTIVDPPGAQYRDRRDHEPNLRRRR